MPRPVRTRISSCRTSRSRASAPLIAGCPRNKRSAARETLFSPTSTWKATSRFRSSFRKSFVLIAIILPIDLNNTWNDRTLPSTECTALRRKNAERETITLPPGWSHAFRKTANACPYNTKEIAIMLMYKKVACLAAVGALCAAPPLMAKDPNASWSLAIPANEVKYKDLGGPQPRDRLGRFHRGPTRLVSAVTQRLRQPGPSTYRRLLRGGRGGLGDQCRSRAAGGRAWARVVLLPARQD